jgi:hypothetical protein
MTHTKIILLFVTVTILTGCSALIYAIRGPKYEGKFQEKYYLPILEDQYYYIHYDKSEDFKDSIRINGKDTTEITRNYLRHLYFFLRYDKDGKIRIKGIQQDTPLESIPSKLEIDKLPVLNERFYVIKDSLIKYEVYHDSYNGYNLYKTRVYADSLVDWEVGISKLHLKSYIRIKN